MISLNKPFDNICEILSTKDLQNVKDWLLNQIEIANNISDHGIIYTEIDKLKICSLNVLDDSKDILGMWLRDCDAKIDKKSLVILDNAMNDYRIQRLEKAIDIISRQEPDIICFQEVNIKQYRILRNILGDKYKFHNNNTLDIINEKQREQYRIIFYKSQIDWADEISIGTKHYPWIIYNSNLIVSIHIHWKINLTNDDNLQSLSVFFRKLIALGLENPNIQRIIIIGDTNNTAENLRKLHKKYNVTIYESDKPTFIKDMNGGDKIDNMIILNRPYYIE